MKKVRILEILLVISLIITIFFINETYSKYLEEMDTYYQIGMKKWMIVVNKKDIQEEKTLNDVMIPNFIANTNMKDNVIVPGRKMYFEFTMDYTNVDVKFKCNFTITQLNDNKLKDFRMIGYTLINNGVESTLVSANEMQLSIDPNEENQKEKKVRVYYEWNDGEDNLMNNLEDTKYKGQSLEENIRTILKYNVSLTFIQDIE